MNRTLFAVFALLFSCFVYVPNLAKAEPDLEKHFSRMPMSDLVKQARIFGDANRGALVFYRQSLSCIQCHTAGEGMKLLGPDLSLLGKRANYEHVIESILKPSKAVEEGFKSEIIILESGKVITGLLKKETDENITVVVPGEEKARSISKEDVLNRSTTKSIMPTGLINQLKDDAEFFDLVTYLVALGEAGPSGAAKLKPEASLIAIKPLPAYENDLDHAGLIKSWNKRSLNRGEKLYKSLCINCHGNKKQAGSLPNALRFATGKFKNGFDPHLIYKTITHGYKMMLPQRQLVPSEKYNVIHYIREEYLKSDNPSQYKKIDAGYLASLPKGKSRGPVPVKYEPWRDMDYGPFLIRSYEMVGPETLPRQGVTKDQEIKAKKANRPGEEFWPENTNFAFKGISIQLDEVQGGVGKGSHWITFDHDTMRVAGAWSGKGFIDWHGVLFDGRHAMTPRSVGDQHFANPIGPGWANPETGTFEDPRFKARDGRRFGPLPKTWAKYNGLYKHENRIVVSYRIGDAEILESYRLEASDVWVRTVNVGKSTHDLKLRVAPSGKVNLVLSGSDSLSIKKESGYQVLPITSEQTPANFELRITSSKNSLDANKYSSIIPEALSSLTQGGPAQWNRTLKMIPKIGENDGPFAVDTLTRPAKNPWKSRLRMSGLDFFPDGDRLVACCCDGDVWIVSGIDKIGEAVSWRRIASGLFHPLGIKIVNEKIYVSCRDQIVILNDLNNDGETDFYECFNNDHQVTDHFHEFAMGLQTDDEGNFYYAKSARHARDFLVPQHGTLLKVSADGATTKILANGFRAANGVCLNPDGSYFVTDQEGHWHPMNRINRVVEGGFYGNIYSYGAPKDTSDSAMEQPMCWPNKSFDRSPSELLWVKSDKWGPLNGSLLNLSYGYGKVYVVPHENLDGQWQGGMCRLPLPQFPTGVMRARFHPTNGQMYACGMHAWGSNQSGSAGGLYRIRYTGKPMHLPMKLNAKTKGMSITFTEPINATTAKDAANYLVETWVIKRTSGYGSKVYDRKSLDVTKIEIAEDQKTVTLIIPDIKPTWCMQIAYKLKGKNGNEFSGVIQNTVHKLAGK